MESLWNSEIESQHICLDLANFISCITGSHITSEDHTYIAIKRSKERRIFDFPNTKKSDVSEEIIYGLSMFVNLPDPKGSFFNIQSADF